MLMSFAEKIRHVAITTIEKQIPRKKMSTKTTNTAKRPIQSNHAQHKNKIELQWASSLSMAFFTHFINERTATNDNERLNC